MKKKKILAVLTISFFLLSAAGGILGAGGEPTDNSENKNIEKEEFLMNLQAPDFTIEGEYVKINLEESETYLSHSGKPMLPVITKTFDFPMNTKINDVNVDIQWEQHNLDKQVIPTPVIIPKSVEIDPEVIEEKRIDEAVYSSTELYPEESYKVKYGSGLNDMEHKIFVNVKCFPQYSPANGYVNIPTEIDITVEYEPTDPPQESSVQYDLIIITHDIFEQELQQLVVHKENKGITTKLVTVDEIYQSYSSESSHDWEQIKMYLADSVLTFDTKYVMLVGGHKGQTHDWWVPDFRSHCWNPLDAYDPPYDETYSSDLYYADVYKTDNSGNVYMDDWDSNGNGIYAEGPDMPSGTDQMDFYPDVHVGRLPLRYEWEADVIVNKIITYENTASDSWFKKAVLAGGDGFPPERYGASADPNIWEGEVVCDEFADLLSNRGVQSTKAYCSDGGDVKVETSSDVYNEITKGCGFVHLTGHANPNILGSYEPGTGISPPPIVPFVNIFNIINQDNKGKLPFMINEGCHNAQFDVTTQEMIDYQYEENPEFLSTRWEWLPHDQSSWMLLQKGGGAISVIGNTALGLGGLNEGCTEFVGGWIMLRFAEAYAVDGKDYTGSVWTTGINGYIDNFDVAYDTGDRKTIEERVLLGDPSLKLGGYGSAPMSDDPEEPIEYGPVSAAAPTWSVGDSWTYALDNININLNPTNGRALTLKLSTGDIKLEVTNVRSDSYVASIKANNVDVTFGGEFDPHVPGEEGMSIPVVSFDNLNINGQAILDKENLGINTIDLGLTIDIADNLELLEELMQFQIPGFLKIFTGFMSIPANIEIGLDFENPFEIMKFPLENEKEWEIPENELTVSIDGSIKSIWLRVLNFLNKFISIVPDQFAKYLPNIDISEILNDLGFETPMIIEIPEVTPTAIEESPVFKVKGSETINTPAGTFNAAKISVIEDNAKLYYAEEKANLVKIVGSLNEYIPIIGDINLELKQ